MVPSARIVAVCGLLTLSATGAARADREAFLKIGDPSKGGKVTIASINEWGGWLDYCTVEIPDPCDAREKARLIQENCKEFTIDWNGDDGLRIGNLKDDVMRIAFYPGDTCEGIDKAGIGVPTTEEKEGRIEFKAVRFEPFDPLRQPAYFTAGIVTDVGELTVRVSSQELNFQTEGPIICQALYDRLAPRAPQYGAQINYAGDRLDIYFAPAYTKQQAYVVFGTTSPTPGCSGAIQLPPAHVKGDLNCDGVVNNFDIDPFVLALTDPAGYAKQFPNCDRMLADVNGDGVVDNFDIDPFVKLLTP